MAGYGVILHKITLYCCMERGASIDEKKRRFTAKEERQKKHIEEAYRHKGKSAGEARTLAFKTVNARRRKRAVRK